MPKKLTALALVAVFLLGQPAATQEKDGPFGLYMGMPFDELGEKEEVWRDRWKLATVPKPYPFPSGYIVDVTANEELCNIVTGSEIIKDRSEVAREFDKIKKQITSLYGEPATLPYAYSHDMPFKYTNRSGAITEFLHIAAWDNEFPPIWRNLQKIVLTATPAPRGSTGSWRVMAVYAFDNFDDCDVVIDVDNPF